MATSISATSVWNSHLREARGRKEGALKKSPKFSRLAGFGKPGLRRPQFMRRPSEMADDEIHSIFRHFSAAKKGEMDIQVCLPPQSSSASRFAAGAEGFFIFSQ